MPRVFQTPLENFASSTLRADTKQEWYKISQNTKENDIKRYLENPSQQSCRTKNSESINTISKII